MDEMNLDFQVIEGAAAFPFVGYEKLRSVPFLMNAPAPSWPAIMNYNMATDEAFWVECNDPYAIHVAKTKNAAAQELAAAAPAPVPLSEYALTWSHKLYDALAALGVSFHYVAPPENGTRIGYQVRIGEFIHGADTQLHVDSPYEIVDPDEALGSLASAIAKKLGPSKELHSCQLFLPNAGYESVRLEHGHLTARAVRSIVCGRNSDDDVTGVSAITRIDVLFPVV
jgi:hypothetical protein